MVKALHYWSDGPGIDSLGATRFFSDIFPSDRTMFLGSTQPLVKMSTRNIPGDKGGRCVRLTTSPPSRAECHEIWEPKPPGTLWATPGLLWDCFTFLMLYRSFIMKHDYLIIPFMWNSSCHGLHVVVSRIMFVWWRCYSSNHTVLDYL